MRLYRKSDPKPTIRTLAAQLYIDYRRLPGAAIHRSINATHISDTGQLARSA
ncbi:hypothetical protein [Nocardia salmonicida]|uniref:hypothetical protein n=1 Tax=Nocardia salmonicida TaxID=53431 RepID=UPI000A86CF1F|nr:hypothetical protein [Nocardia salmonicida]